MDTVDAVLMASGFSARFGNANKLLQPFRGVPLALHTLRLACGIPCFGTVFFIFSDEAVGRLAGTLAVKPLHNSAPHLGQRHSVHLGACASQAAHMMFFSCDQPLLDAPTVTALLAKRCAGRMVFPTVDGETRSPAIFSAAFRDELASLPPGGHARDLKQRHPGALVTVEVPSPLVLADIDTAEDLKRFEQLSL